MAVGPCADAVMKVVYSKEFAKEFKKLPASIQRLYRKQEDIFKENWRDPRLKVKKLKDHPLPFSFRITRGYRVLFVFVESDAALFATIGHRKDVYD
jgi:mRNA-degrading endonuclease RelE of RelBE toxin-antitoxin system